jgi:hypothetical protein
MKTISVSRRACLHQLWPLRPLGSLWLLQSKAGPAIGPMGTLAPNRPWRTHVLMGGCLRRGPATEAKLAAPR